MFPPAGVTYQGPIRQLETTQRLGDRRLARKRPLNSRRGTVVRMRASLIVR